MNITSQIFGETRLPSEQEELLLKTLANETPVGLFQALNKKLNSFGFMLAIEELDKA
jgi:hypothetical protein